VAGISHVINYDMPATLDAYTHRIGRTGRASGTGEAFTFVTGQDMELAQALKRSLGDKLTYHRVDGLTTMVMPDKRDIADIRPGRTGAGNTSDNHKGGRSFSPQGHRCGKSSPRTLPPAGQRSWGH
jgi:superfamily II DNA/RNA helicase